MAVLTTDIMLRGIRREEVFDWLGDVNNQRKILEGAFDAMKEIAPGHWEFTLKTPIKTRVMTYRFTGMDDSHGGRRVQVETSGKRFAGQLHYSLRTLKPSTNTLVTLHMDFDPGGPGPLGEVIFDNFVRKNLEVSCAKVLENLSEKIPRTVGSGAGGKEED